MTRRSSPWLSPSAGAVTTITPSRPRRLPRSSFAAGPELRVQRRLPRRPSHNLISHPRSCPHDHQSTALPLHAISARSRSHQRDSPTHPGATSTHRRTINVPRPTSVDDDPKQLSQTGAIHLLHPRTRHISIKRKEGETEEATACPMCSAAVTYSGRGRRPIYCSTRCKNRAANVRAAVRDGAPLSRSSTSSVNRSPGRAAPPVPIETVVTSQPSNASDDPPDYKADSSRPSGTTLPPDATGTPSILEAPGTSPASNSHSWPPCGSPTDSSRPHRLRSFRTMTRTSSPESWPNSNRTTSITPSRRPPRDSAMPQIYSSASPPRPP